MSTTRLETLDGDACLGLLAEGGVGRIGIAPGPASGRYPLILPVDYRVDDAGVIVLRTAAGTAVDRADHTNVSFEVDRIDRTGRTIWSVLVHGLAERVGDDHDPALVERTHATGVLPTAPGDRTRWFRLIPQGISGRRIVES